MSESDPKLANRILAGLAIGAVSGSAVLALGGPLPGLLEGARRLSVNLFDPLGQVFLRLLFFVIVPLVFASLAGGVAQLGNLSRLGPLAARTFTLFFANMAIAVALTTQCPYCLDIHTRNAKRAGATREEVAEAAFLAAALRAGAAVTHGALALKLFDQH